jgi:hypothetical protein
MLPTLIQIANSLVQGFTILVDGFKQACVHFYAHFGPFGQVAFILVLFYLIFLILCKILKASLDVVFYVVLPSVILSFLTSFVLPYTFVTVLPFCVGLLIVVNIFRS